LNLRTVPPGLGGAAKWLVLAVALLVLFIALSSFRSIYTDWLWFGSVDYQEVYRKILTTRLLLFLIGGLLLALLLGANLALAYRNTAGEPVVPQPPEVTAWLRRLTKLAATLATIFLGFLFGSIASGHWETVLRFSNTVAFGAVDPQFQKDISFYVFSLPFWSFVQVWTLGALVVTLLGTAALYFLRFNWRGMPFRITPSMRWHLSVLGALILLNSAFSYWLDIYQLVYSTDGAVFGASYADIHAKLPALRILIVIVLAGAGLLVASNFFGRALWLMGGVLGLWIGAAIVLGSIYPSLVQRFQVQPSELSKETPYLQREIQATRRGFGLDRMEVRDFPAAHNLDLGAIQRNVNTVSNIRLWDHRPLRSVYNQVQFFKQQYDFLDADVDRYNINGEVRQVMIAARELSPEKLGLEAQTWVNQRLKFTHGYGVAMSPVTEFTEEGRPEFFLQDLPPRETVTQGNLSLSRPEIYYGEKESGYVIVNSREEEFDYPSGDQPVYVRYAGKGGIPLDSLLDKLAFAWQFADINIFISGQITSESRIQYRRNLQEAISTVAPFLLLDGDPYLVVADGAIWWIQDAYTTTNLYPYSRPLGSQFNYVRNSVKVVMSAYDGSMQFFVASPEDPLIQNYQRIFPTLFRPLEEMPLFLKSHIRYPEDLFTWQAMTLLLYHVESPADLYNKGELWSLPNEVVFETTVPMEPYYVNMKLPGEAKEEFVIILPFTPFERKNMSAWFTARSDGEHYGKLLRFDFPRVSQVDGPEQIEARINNDPAIAEQFGLWRRAQVDVLRGNLLVIPIEDSLLYAEPVYLQSQNIAFPELKTVILADATRVTMQPSLNAAVAALFGGAITTPVLPPPTTGGEEVVLPATLLTKLQEGLDKIGQAILQLQEELGALQQTLTQLEEAEAGSP